jgi:hypothetical protein
MMKQHFGVIALMSVIALSFGCQRQTPTEPSGAMSTPVPTSGGGTAAAPTAEPPRNSEQVVFSGVAGIDSTFQNASPAGFWIWCEAESNNTYARECKGAMYFYALGITKHVSDNEDVTAIEEFGDEQYRIRVTSEDGSVDCMLESLAAPVNGPRNSVKVSCTKPAGMATSNTAVVKVTGPGE